jgi:CheY-like chemotaxis protein
MPLSDPSGTILIVEDDAVSRRLYQKALSMERFSVVQAINGQEALEMLNSDSCPDLVMMDLSMPTMDGADFIRALREHPKCAEVKVMIVSGWEDLATRAKDLGADGYISKPVDLNALQKEVRRLIALH